MPRERAVSEVKEPHQISLKVLRLSRPSLAEQHVAPLDTPAALSAAITHSRSYPSASPDSTFLLTPLLTLPPSFGSVFIGESFRCCLSANPESPAVSNVRISAEMQTPSQTMQLALEDGIVTFELMEEGSHVLSVTVAYTQDGARERTFRKLYQFLAQHCVVVRTKTTPRSDGKVVLEAQLENMSEEMVAMGKVDLIGKGKVEGFNWTGVEMVKSRDVVQVAFLVEPADGVVGQLTLNWRAQGGERGFLRTGRLMVPPAS